MKYSVYQIQFSAEQYDAINNGSSVPAFDAKCAMDLDFAGNKIGGVASEAFEAGYYTHVANIEADDFNDCFEVGNIGPDDQIERFGKMSSLSVGDVLVDEEGTVAAIAPVGFVAFSHNPNLSV